MNNLEPYLNLGEKVAKFREEVPAPPQFYERVLIDDIPELEQTLALIKKDFVGVRDARMEITKKLDALKENLMQPEKAWMDSVNQHSNNLLDLKRLVAKAAAEKEAEKRKKTDFLYRQEKLVGDYIEEVNQLIEKAVEAFFKGNSTMTKAQFVELFIKRLRSIKKHTLQNPFEGLEVPQFPEESVFVEMFEKALSNAPETKNINTIKQDVKIQAVEAAIDIEAQPTVQVGKALKTKIEPKAPNDFEDVRRILTAYLIHHREANNKVNVKDWAKLSVWQMATALAYVVTQGTEVEYDFIKTEKL